MLKSQQNVGSRDGHPDTIAHPKGTEPGTNPDPRQEDLNTNPADSAREPQDELCNALQSLAPP